MTTQNDFDVVCVSARHFERNVHFPVISNYIAS